MKLKAALFLMSLVMLTAQSFAQLQTDSLAWFVKVDAKFGENSDQYNYLGVANSATNGLDNKYDIPEPPLKPGAYVSVYFAHPEFGGVISDRYTSDIKANTSLADTVSRWYFDVLVSTAGSEVQLILTETRVPASFGRYLVNLTTKERVELKGGATVKFTPSSVATSFMVVYGDSTAPTLGTITPNSSLIARTGDKFTVTFPNSDRSGLAKSELYISFDKGVKYDTLYAGIANSTLEYTVPAAYLNHNVIFKSAAKDSLGNHAQLVGNYYHTFVGDSLSFPAVAGWRLLSNPFVGNTNLMDDFSSDPFYLFGYAEGSGYTQLQSLNYGNAYWLGALANGSVDFRGVATVSDSSIAATVKGFNLVGGKYVRAVDVNKLQVLYGGALYSFAAAADSGWIVKSVYTYDIATKGYAEATSLLPGEGYWVSVLKEGVSLVMKPITLPVVPPTGPFMEELQSLGITLIAQVDGLIDGLFTLGFADDATVGFDAKYDAPRPPRNPGNRYVELSAINSGDNYPTFFGEKFSKDFRPLSQPINWTIKLESSEIGKAITLKWDASKVLGLPDTIGLLINNVPGIGKVDMKVVDSISFVYTGEIVLTINQALLSNEYNGTVISYELAQNYPNPFNPSTVISFSVPQATKGTLRVYSIVGELVAELVNGEIAAGTHSFQWNASNMPSGVYFYELQTSAFKKKKKMVLMK